METDKAHESLILLADLAGLAASLYMLYILWDHGDNGKLLKMRVMRGASRFSKTQAEWWANTAAQLDTAYIKIAS